MVIRSTFRDYYDSAIAYGHDPARVYERVPRLERIPKNVWPYGREVLEWLDDYRMYWSARHKPGLILFCGRVWPVFSAPFDFKDLLQRVSADPLDHRFRPLDQWIAYYEANRRDPGLKEKALEFLVGDKRCKPEYEILNEMEARRAGRDAASDVLIGLKAPCALMWADRRFMADPDVALIANPRLSDLGFVRLVPPFECFQAIETFLGSHLAPPDLTPNRVGSDTVIAQQKGFGPDSFRGPEPGSKKAARQRNRARKVGG